MRVVSGIQPTGNLHLGNYLGAIRNWVRMQDEITGAQAAEGGSAEKNGAQAAAGGGAEKNEALFFLADLHAISMPHDPAQLHQGTLEMAAALVACGIDPERSILFNQAQVPQHAELQWLLNGTARMGWLNRMTQWKDKAGKNREGASVALFAYPVLQAADVLLYQATHVPVGEDQKQHLELARDIAQNFNHDFASEDALVFTLPDPIVPPDAARLPLDAGTPESMRPGRPARAAPRPTGSTKPGGLMAAGANWATASNAGNCFHPLGVTTTSLCN